MPTTQPPSARSPTPSATAWRRSGGARSDSRELVEAVFELGIFAPALAQATAFVEAVAELHAVLVAHDHRAGIDAAIR